MCVSFFVDGSYICRCRPAVSSGKSFADVRVDPSLQNAGFSRERTAEVSHIRPLSSSIGLWTLFLLVQIGSSPYYGDLPAIFGDVGGVFGSLIVSVIRYVAHELG